VASIFLRTGKKLEVVGIAALKMIEFRNSLRCKCLSVMKSNARLSLLFQSALLTPLYSRNIIKMLRFFFVQQKKNIIKSSSRLRGVF
jgi:hypothetical protein